MYDLISIGDTTTDMFMLLSEQEIRVRDENNDGVTDLIMDFGTKIPIEKLTRIVAVGNAANNAIGASRLGLSAALYTALGEDRDADETREVFKAEGVSLEYVVTTPGTKTNFSAVINVGAERTILVFHEHRQYHLQDNMQGAGWVYYTSLGQGHEELNRQIVEYCQRTGTKLAYQPGSHQLRTGLEVVKPIIAAADFVVMNKEEAQGLTGRFGVECPELVGAFLEMGAKCVAVTDGPKGSFASDGDGVWFCDIYDIEVIERTGCGDAWATGFLSARHKGLAVKEAMEWGTVNAAGKLRFIGAREGLLREQEVRDWIAGRPEFGAVKG